MRYNVAEVMDIVKYVLGKHADGVYLDNGDLEGDYDGDLYSDRDFSEAIYQSGMGYDTAHGVSRFVIIPDKTDYVIKLPITGIYERLWDEETDSYKEPTLVAYANEECDDPTRNEIDIYENASKIGKQILLKNIYVGDYNGIPVYIQKKIDETFNNSSSSCRDLSFEERTLIRNTLKNSYLNSKDFDGNDECTYCPPCHSEFLFDVIKFYGQKKAEEMIRLMREIDDLHGGNIGYVNGRPVVIDYGDFAGEEYLWLWL